MNRKKWMSDYLLAVVVALCCCSSLAAAAGSLTVTVVPRSLDKPIFLDAFEHANRKGLELGVQVEWVAPFNFGTEQQLHVIETLAKRGIHAMLLSVDDTEAVRSVINTAMDHGIAVATFDADSPSSERLFHIGIDNYKAGYAMGDALVDILADLDRLEQTQKTMIMTGVRDALNQEERIQGFLDAVTGRASLDIRDIVENKENFRLSVSQVEGYVVDHPDTDVIFFVGGWPFYVPAEAMPNFQRWSANGGIAVGIDLFYDALLLQSEGLIQYLIGQDFAAMGSLGVEFLVRYLETGDLPEEFVEVGLEHSNADNVEVFLNIHKPWLVR